MVHAVVWSIVLRIRLRSRILRKHDLEIEEICCANDRFLSKKTPRLRAESTCESMTFLGRWIVVLLSLLSLLLSLYYNTTVTLLLKQQCLSQYNCAESNYQIEPAIPVRYRHTVIIVTSVISFHSGTCCTACWFNRRVITVSRKHPKTPFSFVSANYKLIKSWSCLQYSILW